MSNKQQTDHIVEANKMVTAVEWFSNNLKSHFEHDGDLLEIVQMSFGQAKEIEKEQIENAFGVGCQVESKRLIGYQDIAKQYYKEAYETNNKN